MKCPICETSQVEVAVSRTAQALSAFVDDQDLKERVPLVAYHCLNCQFVFLETAHPGSDFERVMKRTYEGYLLLDHCGKSFPLERSDYAYALNFLLESANFDGIQNVLEIGSNRGDFLYHLKSSRRHVNVLGVEPARLPYFGVPTLQGRFDPCLIASRFDLILARHVLEHVESPRDFLRGLTSCLTQTGKVFLEVPNIARELEANSEPFILEHLGYYTSGSLSRLLALEGLKVETVLDAPGRHLCVLAARDPEVGIRPQDPDLGSLLQSHGERVIEAGRALAEAISQGWSLVFFGAGNVYLAAYSALKDQLGETLDTAIAAVVDDSPHRQGRTYYGQRIVASAALPLQGADRLVVIPCTMSGRDAERMAQRAKTWPAHEIKIFLPWTGWLA